MHECDNRNPESKITFSVATNCTEIRIFFLTDHIIRIRAGFDGDFAEESYSLVTTAWEDRMDTFLKDYRKRIQTADAILEDGADQAVIQGKELKVVIEKDPFRICVYDKEGTMIHADIVDLAYREDSNHRRIHTSQIEADDCFYGFWCKKSGELNKAQKYMVLSPWDSMGYDPKETDSLYKHIPFLYQIKPDYSKKQLDNFYHSTPPSAISTWAARSATTGTATAAILQMAEISTFSLLKDLLCARL